MTDAITRLLATLPLPGQPDTLFKAFEAEVTTLSGVEMFTLLLVDGQEVARVYSNRPVEYPVSGRKPMGNTPWGDLVLKRQQPFLGKDKAAIRWAFFDHALIESMGYGSNINVPIVYDGVTLGAISLSAPEHYYTEDHLAKVVPLIPLLIPAFLALRAKIA